MVEKSTVGKTSCLNLNNGAKTGFPILSVNGLFIVMLFLANMLL